MMYSSTLAVKGHAESFAMCMHAYNDSISLTDVGMHQQRPQLPPIGKHWPPGSVAAGPFTLCALSAG